MKYLLSLHIVTIFFRFSLAQTSPPAPSSFVGLSAVVNFESTTQGLLIPRMTSAQRQNISFPDQGIIGMIPGLKSD